MIVVYTSPGCASCRKVKQWLKDRNLPFTEKNIFKTLLDEEEIRYLLMRCGGVLCSVVPQEVIRFIRENPSVLKRPIILNEKSFQVGYDSEEIGVFIPQELRRIAYSSCSATCPNYLGCGTAGEKTADCIQKTN